jgi:phosphotransacetylase
LPKAKDPVLVEYVRRVVSLIERRRVSLEEIWEMLARVLRQHMMVRRKKVDQVVAWLKKNPP